jgi:hypothetical protein
MHELSPIELLLHAPSPVIAAVAITAAVAAITETANFVVTSLTRLGRKLPVMLEAWAWLRRHRG